MLRQSLTGSIVDEERFDEAQLSELLNLIAVWVFCTEGTSMIEVVIDPFLDVAQFTKVYNEAVVVWFFCSKAKFNRPVVSVDEGAMASMERLAVTQGDVAVVLEQVNMIKSINWIKVSSRWLPFRTVGASEA